MKAKLITMCAVFVIATSSSLYALADLPSGYRQLEYVDTDGNQWVNTLFLPNCTNAVEVKASFTNTTSRNQFLYCSRKASSGSDQRLHCLYIRNDGKSCFGYRNSWEGFSSISLFTPHEFFAAPDPADVYETTDEALQGFYYLTGYVDGEPVGDKVRGTDFSPEENAYFCLFASYTGSLDDNTSVNNKAACRFWYFKVWDTKDKKTLLCHIVPVYGIAEGEVGFYDLVAERFLPVHGTAISSGKVVSANYTLTEDEDWSGDNVMLSSGVTVDLAGHNLTIANAWTPTAATNAVSAANADYQDLAYITATGGQSIHITGYKLPGTAKVEMKFRPATVAELQFLFASRTGGKQDTYSALVKADGKLRFDYNTSQVDPASLTYDKDYWLVFDGKGNADGKHATWMVNDIPQTAPAADNNFTGGSDLYLLSDNSGSNTAKCRLYYFTVTTNGTDVALDLRPVRRLSDGAVGLYDRVGGTFYESTSGTAFAAIVNPKFVNGNASASELRVGRELVPGYTIVDCITATGSQYIDTGFVPAATDRMELRASLSELPATGSVSGLFCSRTGKGNNTFSVLYTTAFRFDFNTQQRTSAYTTTVDVPFTVSFDGNTSNGYVNGNAYEHTADNTFTPSAHVYLFAMHVNNGTAASIAKGSIYGFKVTGADGTLKLYMVPVVRSDNVPGLYDRVGRKFYRSSSRTAFTAGSTVGDGKLYVGSDCDLGGAEIAGNVTLEPAVGTISGATLANGVAIDLSGLSSPFSLEDNAILFADNATIGLLLGSRKTHSATPVIAWSVAPENLSSLVFRRIDIGAECTAKKMSDGIYFIPGMIIIVH